MAQKHLYFSLTNDNYKLQITITKYRHNYKLQLKTTNYKYKLQVTIANTNCKLQLQVTITSYKLQLQVTNYKLQLQLQQEAATTRQPTDMDRWRGSPSKAATTFYLLRPLLGFAPFRHPVAHLAPLRHPSPHFATCRHMSTHSWHLFALVVALRYLRF